MPGLLLISVQIGVRGSGMLELPVVLDSASVPDSTDVLTNGDPRQLRARVLEPGGDIEESPRLCCLSNRACSFQGVQCSGSRDAVPTLLAISTKVPHCRRTAP